MNLQVLEYDDQEGKATFQGHSQWTGEAALDVFAGGTYFAGTDMYRVTAGGQTTAR